MQPEERPVPRCKGLQRGFACRASRWVCPDGSEQSKKKVKKNSQTLGQGLTLVSPQPHVKVLNRCSWITSVASSCHFRIVQGFHKSCTISTSISKNLIYPGTSGMAFNDHCWSAKSNPEDLVNIFNEAWRTIQFSLKQVPTFDLNDLFKGKGTCRTSFHLVFPQFFVQCTLILWSR